MLSDADDTVLVIVDVQERLLPAVQARTRIVHNIGRLLRAAEVLAVPVLVSEHNPAGLGRTVPELATLLPTGMIVEKMTFSCVREPAFHATLASHGRGQVVLAGAEAHVCVLQTGLDLQAGGFHCFIVADATSSRSAGDVELGIERMRDNGMEVVTTEMILFEWLRRADRPEFKDLLPIIKQA